MENKKTILILEENESQQTITEYALKENFGYDVISETRVSEVVDKFKKGYESIDLLIVNIDKQMKNFNAITSIRKFENKKLKRQFFKKNKILPIPIITTGCYFKDKFDNYQEFEDANIKEYLQKPFTFDTLNKTIKKCLN